MRRFLETSRKAGLILALLILAFPHTAFSQRTFDVEMKHVRGHLYSLHGSGGTVGVSIGDDGVYLIDDKFSPVTPNLLEAISKFSDQPVEFVINTHWHGDHTGANQDHAASGVLVMAHENVRTRLSTEQYLRHIDVHVPPRPVEALPVLTYNAEISLHVNGDTARVIHVPNAHTDGDSIVVFPKANVIHMGDVYFSGMYPFIDTSSGGHVNGVIQAIDLALEISDDDTLFIAGHGPVTGAAELREYRDDVVQLSNWVRKRIENGEKLATLLDEIDAAPINPAREGFPGESDAAGFVLATYVSITGQWD